MDKLRIPFFLLALLVLGVIIFLELGALQAATVAARLPNFITGRGPSSFDQALQAFSPEQQRKLAELRSQKSSEISQLPQDLSGFGVRSMVFVDGILLFSMLLMGLALTLPIAMALVTPKAVLKKVPPESIHAKVQGLLTLIFAILLILAAIVTGFLILAKLITMVMLLLSFPFGTLAYLIIYGSFPRDSMKAVLSLIFILKVVFGVLLLLAHQKFIENLSLVIDFILALVANLIVTILYTIVPGILVSITDAVAGLIVIIIGVIIAIIMAILSIISIIAAWLPN